MSDRSPATAAEKAALNARYAAAPEDDAPRRASIAGGAFLLDRPEGIPSVWGEGTSVLWPHGEPLYIAGNIGTGKTTLGGQVALARVGIGPSSVLGMPVADDGGRLLYLAMDRPQQIGRALARMVTEDDRAVLDERVTFWRGALPFHLADEPEALAELAHEHEATTLIVDSVKDLGATEKPEVGWAVNAAFQACVASGVQVGAWHHPKKPNGDNRQPRQLTDLYGSMALAAGAGSVLHLWGQAGDPIVELTHLKPAADQVGPWQLVHDHELGRTTVLDESRIDPLAIVRAAPAGLTAKDVAMHLVIGGEPKAADVERARRKLERLVKSGAIVKDAGDPAAHRATLYRAAGGGS